MKFRLFLIGFVTVLFVVLVFGLMNVQPATGVQIVQSGGVSSSPTMTEEASPPEVVESDKSLPETVEEDFSFEVKGKPTQAIPANEHNNITVNVHDVTWPSPNAVDNGMYDDLSAAAQEQISMSPVPVLMPDSPRLVAVAQVTTGPHWYAASISQEDITIFISATNVSLTVPNIAVFDYPKDQVRGVPALITQNEGIWSISWNEFGIAYVLEVECRLSEDPRCVDDVYARELAESLVFVGGAQ